MVKTEGLPARRAGFTMVEVMIASAILAVFVAGTLMVVLSASSTAAEGTLTSDLEARGRRLLETLRPQFMTGRFRDFGNDKLGIYNANQIAWFQIPVNAQGTGQPRHGYTTYLGLNDLGGADKSCVLRFEASTVLRESTAAPSATQTVDDPTYPKVAAAKLPALPVLQQLEIRDIDYNRDLDLNDTFVRGKIVQYILQDDDVYDPTKDKFSVLADNVILAVSASNEFNGDVDNDGSADLLFRYVNTDGTTFPENWPDDTQCRSVEVNVWLGGFTDDGKRFNMRRTRETILLKNKQY